MGEVGGMGWTRRGVQSFGEGSKLQARASGCSEQGVPELGDEESRLWTDPNGKVQCGPAGGPSDFKGRKLWVLSRFGCNRKREELVTTWRIWGFGGHLVE